MSEDVKFLAMLVDSVAEQGEAVNRRASFGDEIRTRLSDVCGVVSYVTLRETKNGNMQVRFKVVIDHGEQKGNYTWGSVTPTDSDGSFKFLSRVISAVNADAAEMTRAGFGSFDPREDTHRTSECLADLLLGKRIRVSVKENDGYWGADFYSRVGEQDPDPEIEVNVASRSSEKKPAGGARPSLDGAPATPAAAPKGRPAL